MFLWHRHVQLSIFETSLFHIKSNSATKWLTLSFIGCHCKTHSNRKLSIMETCYLKVDSTVFSPHLRWCLHAIALSRPCAEWCAVAPNSAFWLVFFHLFIRIFAVVCDLSTTFSATNNTSIVAENVTSDMSGNLGSVIVSRATSGAIMTLLLVSSKNVIAASSSVQPPMPPQILLPDLARGKLQPLPPMSPPKPL